MRLGSYDCALLKGIAYRHTDLPFLVKNGEKAIISERHRHRYEFNNEYRERLEAAVLYF